MVNIGVGVLVRIRYGRHGRGSGGKHAGVELGYVGGLMMLLVIAVIFLGACTNELGQARSLEKKADLESAVALYKEILADKPKELDALNGLALDLLLLRRYDEALSVQERIVALDPKDALTRVELAFNYLNYQEEPDKAVLYLTQAVGIDPSAKNLTSLAQAQIKVGDPAGAEQALGGALKADPTYPHAYVVLLSLLGSQGRTGDAANLREQARQNGVDVGQANGS